MGLVTVVKGLQGLYTGVGEEKYGAGVVTELVWYWFYREVRYG